VAAFWQQQAMTFVVKFDLLRETINLDKGLTTILPDSRK
jgi:hypothetical protein